MATDEDKTPRHQTPETPAHLAGGADSESRPKPQDRTPDEVVAPIPAATKHMRGTDPIDDAAAGVSAPAPENPTVLARIKALPLAAKVLAVFVVALVAVVAWGASYIGGLNSEMGIDEDQREDLEQALVTEDREPSDPFYALIIGSDAREDDEISRSDVIMLARVDPASGTVTLVSIPRDTMIATVGGGIEKINAAYNRGAAAVVSTVSEFAGVDISHYVEVDFSGLRNVVDALGGVTVDVPETFTTKSGLTIEAGTQTLNGKEALAYARERYGVSGGDFSRARAQRQIVEAIAKKVLASSPLDLPGVVQTLAQAISTDLTVEEIVNYALELQSSGSGLTVYSSVCPSYAYEQGGVSYVATMYDEWRALMQRVDAGLDPNDETAEIPEEQASNERLGAATNSASPRDYQQLAASSGLTTEDYAE